MRNYGIAIRRSQLSTTLLVLSLIFSACQHDTTPPLAPEDALKTFALPEGFRIELVASEPQISDPVEIAFDVNGFMYVAEMEDYPAHAAPGGRIVMLEDVDGNGHYEKADVFADSLPYVNGVMPWRKGVLVTSAPDIIYLEDTDGDRRADIREVVITGFAFTNPQLRMSSLRYGLDNWIYGAYSRAGGQRGYPEFTNHGEALKFPANPAGDSADIYPGTDFRFRPDSFLIEPAGGMSQFGLTFDEEGNRFTVWNNIHARHVVMDARYAQSNPFLNIDPVMASISDHGNAATVYSRAENRLDLHESEIGHFTSACGQSIYTGGLFPAPYDGALFVCEPVSNIVHMDVLKRNGATFSASRLEDGKEFLSSTDSWFRPVNTTVGPDGALYVVDFYRKLVEHPAWIARADDKGIYTHAGVLQEADFIEGNDRGRIYRIVPVGSDGSTPSASSGTELVPVGEPAEPHRDTHRLVALLSHKNYFWRINAQRLLVERQDTSVVPALKKIVRESTSAKAKVHALRTLEGLRALDEEIILTALGDEDPFLQKQAVLVAEPYLSIPSVRDQILSMASDEDTALQFQVVQTLSLLPAEISFLKVQPVARQHITDEWFHRALLLGARDNALQWFRRIEMFPENDEKESEGKLKLLRQVAAIAGRRADAQQISQLVTGVASSKYPSLRRPILEGLVEGMPKSIALSTAAQDALIRMIVSAPGDVQSASISVAEKIKFERWPQLERAMARRINDIFDPQSPVDSRKVTVRILGLNPLGVPIPTFRKLLSPEQPHEIQSAAARALILKDDAAVLQLLCERYNASAPEVRAIMESGFTRSANRIGFFVDAMERGLIDPALLSPAFRSRLVQHPHENIGQRAQKLVANVLADSRTTVVNDYYRSTILAGDPAKGKDIFRSRCSACHQLGETGRAFGPDLLSVTNQTRINLLTMIIDPNNNIAPGYDGYFIETKEGRTFTGIIGSETSSGITFRTPDGKDENISRESIAVMRPMTTSLMPEGLEAGLTKEEMADLLEFLKHTGSASP